MAIQFSQPVVAICEGPADAHLIKRLIERENLAGYFVHETHGYQHFSRAVTAIATSSDRAKLQRLIIIGDNDLEPDARWHNARDALAAEQFPVPNAIGEIANGEPSTAIFMVPGAGLNGTLETLLVEALIENKPEVGPCLTGLEACAAHCAEWDEVKRAKMRFQAAVAITCRDDPSAGAAHIWSKAHNPILATSTAFDGLAAFLRAVAIQGV